ncbi:type IV secretory system conjugative DNA transfer family protein [Burkholderia cenocepacia]|uniref:type IV secretory system conjugative DNA transfer family protein n=1 Tax=Burkholderia cenocepacia TaxID=95486 RepID=UPI001AA11C27|nr:type IV secretory system conjugative DNA transfer family protein [Burkholderia cenocepacia]MBO1859313.1 type IV secretory system conjugative DNA transfer family protein [Burkholderia cenocepacia]
MDLRDILERLWAAILALFFGAWCVSMAPAHANIFPACDPATEGGRFFGDADADAWVARVCDAQNSTYQTWQERLQTLDLGQQDLSMATNAGDWQSYREKWAELLPILKEMETAAMVNRTATGAAPIVSLYRSDLAYFLQNAGLGTANSLEAFSERVIAGLDGERPAAAATAGVNVVQQSVTRGVEFVRGLAAVETDKVLAEYRADTDARIAERNEQLQGTTLSGYFGGFGRRISEVSAGWLFMLVTVCFGGAWLAHRRKQNPVTVGVAVGLAYLVPSVGMVLLFVFLPFIPGWFVLAATVAGTVATYLNAGKVFAWLASGVGYDSPTGRRLRVIGATIDNLRGTPSAAPAVAGIAPIAELAEEAKTNTHGSARWGTVDEIRQGGHLVAPGKPAGFALGRVADAPAGLDQRFRFTGHVVTVAPTGSGKGIGAVIPNLLDYPGSALVLDVKGENAAVTARARRALGQAVYVVDPFAVNGDGGAAFNVLDRLDVWNPDCVSESAILADALVIAESKGDGVHFDESAKNFLQGLMLYVAGLDDVERRHLGELRRLLTAGEDEFFGMLGAMAADETAAFGIPARAANTLMGMADKERGSVLSTARRNTAFLDDPRIAAALSRSDFDLSAIKANPMTVYLVMPANRIGPNARFLRLFISSVIASITASNVQPTHRVAFLLDEFAQLGYMKQIEDAVSLMRGYGLAFWVFIQDLSQLKGVYPKWQTFLANSAKSFYGTDDYDTAKYISDSLGKATIEFETENSGQNSGTGLSGGGGSMNRGKSTGTSQQFTGRELLTPDEVMRLGPEHPIVLVRGERPYLLGRLNYLADPEYAGLFDANPYHS